jgi:predicted RNase H-like HicB family nuclease
MNPFDQNDRIKRRMVTEFSPFPPDNSEQCARLVCWRWRLAETRVLCYKIDMEIKLTAVFRKFPQGYAAFVEELPGANTQGATLEEARENLQEAVAMVLQANRELAEESLRGAEVVREPLSLTTA